jgi:WYL domain
MTARKIARTRVSPRHAQKTLNDGGLEWRLAKRGPIRAYDEFSDVEIELRLGQKDSSSIEGLLIDFRYVAADGEISRRSLLCWQCGSHADKIYVRGYCPFREELRTFRIDRMSDVIAFLGGQETPIDDVRSFFAGFAASAAKESEIVFLEMPES